LGLHRAGFARHADRRAVLAVRLRTYATTHAQGTASSLYPDHVVAPLLRAMMSNPAPRWDYGTGPLPRRYAGTPAASRLPFSPYIAESDVPIP
jgi:hypothetical protein